MDNMFRPTASGVRRGSEDKPVFVAGIEPPAWKRHLSNSTLVDTYKDQINDENQRAAQDARVEERRKAPRAPSWKSGIGTVKRKLDDGTEEEYDANDLLDDPEVGPIAEESLFKRDIFETQGEIKKRSLLLEDPSRPKGLSDRQREDMNLEMTLLDDKDAKKQEYTKRLADDDALKAERSEHEQAIYDNKMRLLEMSQGGIAAWRERRKPAPTLAGAVENHQAVNARAAEFEKRAADLAAEEAELAKPVKGAELAASAPRRAEVALKRQQLEADKAAFGQEREQSAATVATQARREADAMDGKFSKEASIRQNLATQGGVELTGVKRGMAETMKTGLNNASGGDADTRLNRIIAAEGGRENARKFIQSQIAALSGNAATGSAKEGVGKGESKTEIQRLQGALAALTKQDEVFAKNGITDPAEQDRILADAAKESQWTENDTDKVRTLSTGELAINPGMVFGDREAVVGQIQGSSASEAEKSLAVRKLDAMRVSMAEKLENDLYYGDTRMFGIGEFRDFLQEKEAQGQAGDKVALLDEWSKKQKDRNAVFKMNDALWAGVAKGEIGIAKTVVGTAAGVAGAVGADSAQGLGKTQQMLGDAIQSGSEAEKFRGQTGAYGLTSELASTVTQMAPMLYGGQIAQGLKGVSSAVVGGMSVYGWAAAQGYESKLSDAVDMAREAKGSDLTGEEIATVLGDGKTQAAAFLNGAQTAILAKVLGGGAERAALGKAANSMTVRDFVRWGGAKALRDGVLKSELKAMGKTIFADASDEFVEEFTNQLLDGIISSTVLDKEMQFGDLLVESFKAGGMGALVGGGLPQVRKNTGKGTTSPPAPATPERVNAEILANDPDAEPATAEEVTGARDVVGDDPADAAEGVMINREVAAVEAEAAQALADAEAQLLEAQASGDKGAVTAAESNVKKARGAAAVGARVRGALKIARGGDMSTLTDAEARSLGIKRKGDSFTPMTTKELEAEGLTRPLLDFGADDSAVILDEVLSEIRSISPAAAARVKLTETEARKAAQERFEESELPEQTFTVTGRNGTSMTVKAKTADEAQSIAAADPAWPMGEQVAGVAAVSGKAGKQKGAIPPVQITNIDDLVSSGGGTVQVSNNGKAVKYNQFGLVIDGNTAEVAYVDIDPSERGRGIGMQAYVALGEELAKRGIRLRSSKAQYGPGKNLWLKLAAAGLAKPIGQGAYEFVPASQGTANAGTAGSGVTGTGSAEAQGQGAVEGEPSSPPQPTATPTPKPAPDTAKAVLRRVTRLKKNPKLAAAIVVSTDPKVRVVATDDGKISINLQSLAKEADQAGLKGKEAETWIASVIDEEIRHLAQHEAAQEQWKAEGSPGTFKAWRAAHYKTIWVEEFVAKGMAEEVRALYGATAFDALQPWQQAMEGLRMVSQKIATGNPTEASKLLLDRSAAFIAHIRAALKALKDFVAGIDASPALLAEIAAMEAALATFQTNEQSTPNPRNRPEKQPAVPSSDGDVRGTEKDGNRKTPVDGATEPPRRDPAVSAPEGTLVGKRVRWVRRGESLSGTVTVENQGFVQVKLDAPDAKGMGSASARVADLDVEAEKSPLDEAPAETGGKFDQKEYSKRKAKLKKLVKAEKWQEVVAEAEDALAYFEKTGFPDDWSDWERAKEDAQQKIKRTSQPSESNDLEALSELRGQILGYLAENRDVTNSIKNTPHNAHLTVTSEVGEILVTMFNDGSMTGEEYNYFERIAKNRQWIDGIVRDVKAKLPATTPAPKTPEESNYKGKPVSVNGKNGEVTSLNFGKVSVKFSDGTKGIFEPSQIQPPVAEEQDSVEESASIEAKAKSFDVGDVVEITMIDGASFIGKMNILGGVVHLNSQKGGVFLLDANVPDNALGEIERIERIRTAAEDKEMKDERAYGEIAYKQPTTRDEYEETMWQLLADMQSLRGKEFDFDRSKRAMQLERQFNRLADQIELAKTKRNYMGKVWKSVIMGRPLPRVESFTDGPLAALEFTPPKPSDFEPNAFERRKRQPLPIIAYSPKAEVEWALADAERTAKKTKNPERRERFNKIAQKHRDALQAGKYLEAEMERRGLKTAEVYAYFPKANRPASAPPIAQEEVASPQSKLSEEAKEKARKVIEGLFAAPLDGDSRSSDSDAREALNVDQREKFGVLRDQPARRVSARLDLPSLRRGTAVLAIHEPGIGKVIGYDTAVRIFKAQFKIREEAAMKIRDGKARAPIAAIEGLMVEAGPSVEIDLSDGWETVRYNPKLHSYFFTADESGMTEASEVVLVGPVIYARHASKKDKDGFLYAAPLGEVFDNEIPADRFMALMEVASDWIKSGVNTPESLAVELMGLVPDNKAVKFSQPFWFALKAAGAKGAAEPDWAGVYRGIDSQTENPAEEPQGSDFDRAAMDLAGDLADRIRAKQSTSIQELTRLAEARFGGKTGTAFQIKDAYDSVEMAINILIADSDINVNSSPEEARSNLEQIREWLKYIPTQTRRTAEMDNLQQFSTPPHFSYIASWAAGVTSSDVGLEPSAGLGGLAAWTAKGGAEVYLNELSPRRRGMLDQLHVGPPATGHDAGMLHAILLPSINSGAMSQPTVVVMNPPFSNNAAGRKDLLTGGKHIEEALKLLAPGGRLVAIVGEGMALDAPTYKPWWDKIREKYDVRANIHVDGREYMKYGTTFSNRILIIDKVAPTGESIVGGEVKTIEELIPMLDEVRQTRPKTNERDVSSNPPASDQQGGVDPSLEGETDSSDVPGTPDPDARPPSSNSGGRGGRGGRSSTGGKRGGRTGNRNGNTEPSNDPGTNPDESVDGSSESDTGGNDGVDTTGLELESGEADAVNIDEAEVFTVYKPRKLRIKGSQPHPSELVESSSMATVDPPNLRIVPNLPQASIETGQLSDAQLETIAYAAQAHEEIFEDGNRQGYFIGDGTGVGKGREIAGIVLHNWREGRQKAVWISEKKELHKDARRDLDGIGGKTIPLADMAKNIGAPQGKGVAFLTYSGLKENFNGIDSDGNPRKNKLNKPSRIENLVKWLGKDFDGVIALDEVHNAGNVLAIKGARGTTNPSQVALRVVDLQKLFPKARFVYVSATGATEPNNIAFAERLGLWGQGRAFSNVVKFYEAIKGAGLSAMEIFARDLKALGLYTARTLSFKGVGFQRVEHQLTPEQEELYSKAAEGWQVIFQNLDTALDVTGQGRSAASKSAAASAFWSTQQRFFNNLLTSLQMPTVLADMRKRLAENGSIVIQLVGTNEAALDRALARAASENPDNPDYENIDLSNRQDMLEYIHNSFPVQQFHEVADGETADGTPKTKWVALTVTDENGNVTPVLNPEAVAMRDELLEEIATLKLPDPPIEQILNAFGHEAVAEITGRKRRLVRRKDDNGVTRRLLETKRGDARLQSEKNDFLDGKRRILIFSDKGGTGFSYHAGKSFKNQQRRFQYVVQAGWRADKAIQGLGRTHRADQVNAPSFILSSTNVRGHQRFISTIARRLQQLGALTSGERKSTGQGLFNDNDNLEDDYGQNSVDMLFQDLFMGRIPGLNFQDVTFRLGYVRTRDGEQESTLIDESGSLNRDKIPDIRQFLNRILALPITEQNAVYDAFMERRQILIEQAKRNGTYDVGVETFIAPDAEITSDDTVLENPASGAKTRLTEIKYRKYHRLNTFETILGEEPVKFAQNRRTGKIFAYAKASTPISLENGNVEDAYFQHGIKSAYDKVSVPEIEGKLGKRPGYAKIGDQFDLAGYTWELAEIESDGESPKARVRKIVEGQETTPVVAMGYHLEALFNQTENVVKGVNENANYLPAQYELTQKEARDLWEKEYEEQPKYDEEKATFIVGTIIPVWHRIPAFYKKVRRVTLANGQSFLGVEVPEQHVAKTRDQLGAAAGDLGPRGLIDAVKNRRATVILSNGWRVKYTLSAGEGRMEVVGPDPKEWIPASWDKWNSYFGGFIERINFQNRFFLTDNEKKIDELLRYAPPMEVQEPPSGLQAASLNREDQDRALQASRLWSDDLTGYKQKVANLLPSEKAQMRKDTAAKFVEIYDSLPSEKEMAAVALGGIAKRGWYKRSAEALVYVFGFDAPRFAALLAAMSPQTSVESNLKNALNTWKNWVKAGRPTDRDSILRIMGESVERTEVHQMGETRLRKLAASLGVSIPAQSKVKTIAGVRMQPTTASDIAELIQTNRTQDQINRASVLGAWENNTVRALTAEDPETLVISGPKVNSFMLNLRGVTNEVTNDAWMANFALVDQKLFAGSMTKSGPGKGPGYLAMSARTRAAAKYLTKITGEEWTPAEVQETVWSWAKTLYELQLPAGEDRTALQILRDGELTENRIAATPDFAILFLDEAYRKILKESGYEEQLKGLGGIHPEDSRVSKPRSARETEAASSEAVKRAQERAARRLTSLREIRLKEASNSISGLQAAPLDRDGQERALDPKFKKRIDRLTRLIDLKYETGKLKGIEDLEAQLENLLEEIDSDMTGREVDFENEPAEDDSNDEVSWPTAEEELTQLWLEWTGAAFTSKGTPAELREEYGTFGKYVREIVGEGEPGMPSKGEGPNTLRPGMTDEQIEEAAKDAAENYERRFANLKQANPLRADSPEWKAMSKEERMAYLQSQKSGVRGSDLPNPTSQKGLEYSAREADRVLDELASSLPEKLASQVATFRESARGVSEASEGADQSGQRAVSSDIEWAKSQGRLIDPDNFERLGDADSNVTSEHEVWAYGSDEKRAVKRTWAGVFGQVPALWQGKILMKNASLPEYLRRMALQIAVFGSDIRFEGVTVSDKPSMIIGQPAGQPSAVISQEWITAANPRLPHPEEEQIAAFMRGKGFRKIRDSFHGWAREDGVIVMDAKPDNFILSDKGIVPIDLQMGAIGKSEVGGLDYGEGLRAAPLDQQSRIDRLMDTVGTPDPEIMEEVAEQQRVFKSLGKKVVGRPDLANPGRTEEERALFDQVDEARKWHATRETFGQWISAAQQRNTPENDADLIEKVLSNAAMADKAAEMEGMDAAPAMTPEDTIHFRLMLERRTREAGGDRKKLAENAVLRNAYRSARAAIARSLASGRDIFMTPEERHREVLVNLITELPVKAMRQIDARKWSSPQARDQAVQEEIEKRLAEFEKQFKKLGITLEEITNKEVFLSLSQNTVLKNIVKNLATAEKMAVQMMQKGAGFDAIRRRTGLPEAKIEAIRAKVEQELRDKLYAKVKAGLTLEDLRDQMKGEGLNAADLNAATPLTEAQIQAELDRIIAVGFGIPKEITKTSGFKPRKVKEEPDDENDPQAGAKRVIRRWVDRLATSQSDTLAWKSKNGKLTPDAIAMEALIREHVKTGVDDFIDKAVALGATPEQARVLDGEAGTERARVEMIREARKAGKAPAKASEKKEPTPEEIADRVASRWINKLAASQSDTLAWKTPAKTNELEALIREHLKKPVADFIDKAVDLGATPEQARVLDGEATTERARKEMIAQWRKDNPKPRKPKAAKKPHEVDWNRPEFSDGLESYVFEDKDRSAIMQKVIALRDIVGAAGRVNALPPGEKRAKAEVILGQIENLLKQSGSTVQEVLAGGIPDHRFNIADSHHVAMLARTIQAMDSDLIDKSQEYAFASMLSGLQTNLVNLSGGIVNSTWQATGDRAFEALTNLFFNDPSNATFGEVKYMLRAMGPMLSRAWSNAVATWGSETSMFEEDILNRPPDLEKMKEGVTGYRSASIEGTKGRIIRIPLRGLLAADNFVATARACVEVGAMAYRLARMDGLKPGSPEFEAFVKKEVNIPGSMAWQLAAQKAYEGNFNNALPGQKDALNKPVEVKTAMDLVGYGIQSISTALNPKESDKVAAKLGKAITKMLFFPFVRVPYNILKQGIDRSINPISLAEVGTLLAFNLRYRDGKWTMNADGQKQRIIESLGKQLQGTMVMMLLMALGEGDDDDLEKKLLITGSRPYRDTKKGERELGYRTGLGPYEISFLGKDGKRYGFSYGRIEPVATIMGGTVDMMKNVKAAMKGRVTKNEALGNTLNAYVAQVNEKTMLRGAADLMAILNNEKPMDRYAADRISIIMPNLIKQAVRESDGYFRETPTEFQDMVLHGIWPAGMGRPVRTDLYGAPQKKDGSALQRMVDFTDAGETEPTKDSDRMLYNWIRQNPATEGLKSVPIPQGPDKNWTDPLTKKVQPMTAGQRAKFGEIAGTRLRALTKGMAFNAAKPTEFDMKRFRAAIDKSRDDARKILYRNPTWRAMK
jgi:hypothetical protein